MELDQGVYFRGELCYQLCLQLQPLVSILSESCPLSQLLHHGNKETKQVNSYHLCCSQETKSFMATLAVPDKTHARKIEIKNTLGGEGRT